MSVLGKRIKKRREELNLTQEELAQKLGYRSKTTIGKIECGVNDITQSKVAEFAKALETTPAYLMGWEDNLTTDNAELTVELMTRKDCIEVVRILLRNDEEYNKQVLQYCIFLETQK